MQAGDYILNNCDGEEFLSVISYIDDGKAYFTNGDDLYFSPVKAAFNAGTIDGATCWRATDYEPC